MTNAEIMATARELAEYLVSEHVSCMTEDLGPEPRDGFGGLYCLMCRASARIPEHLGGLQHTSGCLVGAAEKLIAAADKLHGIGRKAEGER